MARGSVVQVMVEEELKNLLDEHAIGLGLSTSSYVRGLVIKDLLEKQVLSSEVLVRLIKG